MHHGTVSSFAFRCPVRTRRFIAEPAYRLAPTKANGRKPGERLAAVRKLTNLPTDLLDYDTFHLEESIASFSSMLCGFGA
jgi:hypothetical protein